MENVECADLQPTGLRTEYRLDPLGVDSPTPRLSWELRSVSAIARGLRQIGFELVVATDPSRLTPDTADLWSTSEVVSSETAHVVYAGHVLCSRMRCWWRVRAREASGKWSEWSEAASWTMGLLAEAEWQGKWIGSGASLEVSLSRRSSPNTLPDLWLRQSVVLQERATRATAFIASIGYHELYVNGVKAGDAVLVPNVTDNSKRARYVAYEIGSLLRPGENVFGLWLGPGWSIFSNFVTADKPRAPIVLGQFDIDWASGESLRIATNREWKTHASPSMLLGSWDFRDFGGELYDANKEIAGWSEAALDDANWRPAVEFDTRITVTADSAEPNRLTTELAPVEVQQVGDQFRFDFGRNFSGWIEFTVRGQPGDRISIHYSERPERQTTHGLHSAYIIGASGAGVFRNRFNYGVGRWITVGGLRYAPELDDLRGWLVRPAYSPAAVFSCSVPLFNDIWRTTLWSFENLTLGGYIVDCPHRERMGYGGDAYATTLTGLTAYQLGAFFTKWSEDWRDVQGRTPTWGSTIPAGQPGAAGEEDGNVPYTAPTYWGGGGPAWSGYPVYVAWEVYRRYGDEQILRANFPALERWLAFLETKADGRLLERYGGLWDFLGDWLWPDAHDVNGDTRETLFFNNCYWIYNLQVGAKIAGIVGRSDLRDAWQQRADRLRQEVHQRFFNPSDASYVNGFQAYLGIALFVHLPPPALRAAVWKRLEHEILVVRRGHIHAGITGGALLFQLLMENGRDDLIYPMVDRVNPPSWGAMLRAGATTFWEAWTPRADSLLHSSFLFVGSWFIHGVLGIQPGPQIAGFARFVVRPGVIDHADLTSAEGHYDSLRGRISVAWRRAEGKFNMDVTLPPNTRARVYLPVQNASSVRESGHDLRHVDGIEAVESNGTSTVVVIGSGQFHFSCPYAYDCEERRIAPRAAAIGVGVCQ